MPISISMKMLLSRSFLLVVGLTYFNMSLSSAFAFYASPSPLPSHRQLQQQQQQQPHVQPLQMAGFGGGSSSGGDTKTMTKKKKGGSRSTNTAPPPLKLKAKSQWDRYCDPALNAATSYPVAVRVIRSGSDNDNASRDWIVVGKVKSEDDALTEIAVALQRGIIVEHAKRLVPGQVKPKDLVEWGYGTPRMSTVDAHDDDDDVRPTTFILVDHKSVLKDAPQQGVERKIGFEGTPDPKTGLYCTSNSGRMLDRTDAGGERAKGSLLDRSVLPRIK